MEKDFSQKYQLWKVFSRIRNQTAAHAQKGDKCPLKWYCDQKNNSLFSLDFKSMLTKYQLTQVLSSDFKKTPVYFNWNFLIYWSAITNFKISRELGRGENDVKDALV